MPKAGHFGGWYPLPKDHFRSRWKRFYKRSYRPDRGLGINTVDRPPPYSAPYSMRLGTAEPIHPDSVPSPWRVQCSGVSGTSGASAEPNFHDQRRAGYRMYRSNVKAFTAPAIFARSSTALDVVLRCIDPGRQRGRSDSGLGRPELFGMRVGGRNSRSAGDSKIDAPQNVPHHIYTLMEAASHDHGQEFLEALSENKESFALRRLYELCEEYEIVWHRGQAELNRESADEESKKQGRFPRVDEQASLVDDLALRDILKLRHKTNRRCHPKWVEITYQHKKGHKQYLRRRHMLQDEAKARMSMLSLDVE